MSNITVNGKAFEFLRDRISYNDIIHLADKPLGPVYTVTYSGKMGEHSANGILCPGETTSVLPTMHINVAVTGNA